MAGGVGLGGEGGQAAASLLAGEAASDGAEGTGEGALVVVVVGVGLLGDGVEGHGGIAGIVVGVGEGLGGGALHGVVAAGVAGVGVVGGRGRLRAVRQEGGPAMHWSSGAEVGVGVGEGEGLGVGVDAV